MSKLPKELAEVRDKAGEEFKDNEYESHWRSPDYYSHVKKDFSAGFDACYAHLLSLEAGKTKCETCHGTGGGKGRYHRNGDWERHPRCDDCLGEGMIHQALSADQMRVQIAVLKAEKELWEKRALRELLLQQEQAEQNQRLRAALEDIVALHSNESTDTTCCEMSDIAYQTLAELSDEKGE